VQTSRQRWPHAQTNVAARVRRALPCVCGQIDTTSTKIAGNATSTLEGPLRHAVPADRCSQGHLSSSAPGVVLCIRPVLMLHAHVRCLWLHASCLHVSCFMLHVSCFMLHVSCFMFHVSMRFMLHAL
jgi:hypothetical protein